MPVHDWTRVSAGLFHHFHQRWIGAISDVLNSGMMPPGYFALAEQVVSGPIPDVITLQLTPKRDPRPDRRSALAVAEAPPRTRLVNRTDSPRYATKANRVAVHHESGAVVAVIEIVSPGNKDSKHAFRSFVTKATELLAAGVHLLIVDLFPPTPRDPQGIHKAIWDEIREEEIELPPDKPLTLAAYVGGDQVAAYVEPIAVGDTLPDMPLFLDPTLYVPVPLEATYQTTWAVYPAEIKPALEASPQSSGEK
jgi:hypothetical protein